jgi:hypothetical protein
MTSGSGGSGIVVVRYQIGTVQTGTAKATGGAISYYGGKTIHTFTSSGLFTNTSGSSLTIDYIAVAGGGAGGVNGGGGGGAGGVVSSIPGFMPVTTPIPAVGTGAPNAITITIGSGGAGRNTQGAGGDGVNTNNVSTRTNICNCIQRWWWWKLPNVAGTGGNGSYGSGGGGGVYQIPLVQEQIQVVQEPLDKEILVEVL